MKNQSSNDSNNSEGADESSSLLTPIISIEQGTSATSKDEISRRTIREWFLGRRRRRVGRVDLPLDATTSTGTGTAVAADAGSGIHRNHSSSSSSVRDEFFRFFENEFEQLNWKDILEEDASYLETELIRNFSVLSTPGEENNTVAEGADELTYELTLQPLFHDIIQEEEEEGEEEGEGEEVDDDDDDEYDDPEGQVEDIGKDTDTTTALILPASSTTNFGASTSSQQQRRNNTYSVADDDGRLADAAHALGLALSQQRQDDVDDDDVAASTSSVHSSSSKDYINTYTAGEDGSRLAHAAHELGLQQARQPRAQVRQPKRHKKKRKKKYFFLQKSKQDKGKAVPCRAYLAFLFAITALSSIGPFLSFVEGVTPTLKVVWRSTGTAIILIPVCLQSLVVTGVPQLTLAQWSLFLFTALCYCFVTVAYAAALDYTTVGNVAIFANAKAVILLLAKMAMGYSVVVWEILGVIVATGGATLCSSDGVKNNNSSDDGQQDGGNNDGGNGDTTTRALLGDALALSAALGGIGYITIGKLLRPKMDVSIFMFLMMVTSTAMIIVQMYMMGETITFDRHMDHGFWGWTHLRVDRLPTQIVVVLVCNIAGMMEYIQAYEHFSSVTLAVSGLVEPILATLIAVAMGVGELYGLAGWIGNILVIVGMLGVMYRTITGGEEQPSKH